MPRLAPSPGVFGRASFARALDHRAEIERKRAASRADFNTFAEHLLVDRAGEKLPPSPYSRLLGDTLVWAKANGKHLGHMGPPGLGKSTIMGAFFVHALGLSPTLATVVISAESRPAENRVALCRRLVTLSRFRHVFPGVKPDLHRGEMKREEGAEAAMGWRCNAFYFANVEQGPDPAMSASAAVPKTEARRVNMLLGDDLMSRTVAASAAMKKEIIDATMETWLIGRLSNGGWACITHNCWTRDDLLHYLIDDTRFTHLWCGVDPSGDCDRMFAWIKNAGADHPLIQSPDKYGAFKIETPSGWDAAYSIALPPGRKEWTPEHLRGLRDNPKTAQNFGQLFGLRAQTPEDLVFQGWAGRAQFPETAAGLAKLQSRNGFPIATPLDRMRLAFGGGLDLSGAGRRGIVLTIKAREQVSHRLLPIFHRRYNDLEPVMEDLCTLWDNGIQWRRFLVENNGVQSTILQFLSAWARRQGVPWQHRIEGFHTGNQKSHPEQGLPGMDAMLRSGEFAWPARESSNPENPNAGDWRQWEFEMANTTREQIAKAGGTPDSIMSAWFAERALDGSTAKVSGKIAVASRRSGIGL